MSKEVKVTLSCSKCGAENIGNRWNSLNAQTSPKAKQELLKGDLFKFECKLCGHANICNYSMLYHDMDKKFMVYYVLNQKEYEKVLKNLSKMGIPSDYRFRIVFSHNELIEKVLIFEQNLDDRIVEMVKSIYREKTWIMFPSIEINGMHFIINNLYKRQLVVLSDKSYSVNFDQELYDELANTYKDKLEEKCIIDERWAKDILKNNENEVEK